MSTPSSTIYDSNGIVISSSEFVNALHNGGYGTSTQVWTSNGPGSDPTWSAPVTGISAAKAFGLIWVLGR